MEKQLNTNEFQKTLSEVLIELFDKKGISMDKLAAASNIPKRYVLALRDGDIKNLPAAPYVRGYLLKIGSILDVNGEILWKLYEREDTTKTSGEKDTLPYNRYATKPINKNWFIAAAIVLLVGGYLTVRLDDLIGTPKLEVSLPEEMVTVDASVVVIGGLVSKGDALTINNESILVNADGSFQKELLLEPGVNTVELKATRFLGREISMTRQILYEPLEIPLNENGGQNKTTNGETNEE